MADDKVREEMLRAMTTRELIDLANSQGLGVPEDATKAQALAALGVAPAKK